MNALPDKTAQYLTFALGKDTFAVDIAPIREIIEYPGLTEIPMMPDFLRGVINLRGAVVPVIDLSVRFGRGETAIGRRTCVVIIEIAIDDGQHALGILVDGVNEVLEVETSQIENRPEFGMGMRADFVNGMIRIDGRFIIILDVNQVLSSKELIALVDQSTGGYEPAGAQAA
jgi:purine-binding chemotaxis protein CheW